MLHKGDLSGDARRLPTPLDPSIGSAIVASFSPFSAAASQTFDEPKSTKGRMTATHGSPMNTSSSSGSTTSSLVSRRDSEDWVTLKRRLQALGVTRYTIEGEVGGQVVFTCLVPLVGRQAVSQRFEGEGRDDLTAGQAAIRRIGLWRASRTLSTLAN
jgi:hypothetical protein